MAVHRPVGRGGYRRYEETETVSLKLLFCVVRATLSTWRMKAVVVYVNGFERISQVVMTHGLLTTEIWR